MVWVNIPNSDIDQDSPVTVALMTALRDNPEAIADGDSGAPRIRDSALSTAVTTAGRDWVRFRYRNVSQNSIGSLILAKDVARTDEIVPGNTRDGTELRAANTDAETNNTALPGIWRALGYIPRGAGSRTTLWLRTS